MDVLGDFYEVIEKPNWQLNMCKKLGGDLGVRLLENSMLKLLQDLVESGIDLNRIDHKDKLPVWSCLLEDNEVPISLIEYILNHGATVPPDAIGKRLIMWAGISGHGDPKVIELLINHGADPAYIDSNGETALYIACQNNNISLETIKLLVACGSPINQKSQLSGRTPLIEATLTECDIDVLEFLVHSGADVNAATNRLSETPLMYACTLFDTNPAYVELLIEAGADIHKKNRAGYSAAGLLCKYSGDAALLQILSEHGLDIHTREHGYTLLIIAAMHGNWDIAKKILSLGFTDIEATDEESGKTVMELMRDGESKNMLRKILRKYKMK
jgi:ankyrin repeat protein